MHLTRWGSGNAVRSGSSRRVEDIHCPGRWIKPPVNSSLTGEPEKPALIEGGGIEIRVPSFGRQRKDLHLLCRRVHAHNRVESAVRHPRRAVRADDDAVRSGTCTERNFVNLAGQWVE